MGFSGGMSTFNARVESAVCSRLWSRLIDTKRGIVLFDGFYEWKTVGKTKTPMFIRNRDGYVGHIIPGTLTEQSELVRLPENETQPSQDGNSGCAHAPLMLAALYDTWQGVEDRPFETVTILTMDPDGTSMMDVHDRMPIFLTTNTAVLWLDHSRPFGKIIGTVVKNSQLHAQNDLLLYEVSPLVSNIRNESPDCILPKKEYDENKFSSGLGRFFKKAGRSGETVLQQDAMAQTTKRPLHQQAEEIGPTKSVRID